MLDVITMMVLRKSTLRPFASVEVTVVEYLQEQVEDLGVGLLDLVQQDAGVAAAAHGVGQLAALLVADVAGRRADEPGHGVALHELRHVEAHHRLVGAEHELRERLHQFRLADAGGAEEEEAADGALGVLEAGAGAADRLGDGDDGLLLADDAAVDVLLHVQETLDLLDGHVRHGDARPHADDFGDLFLGDRRLLVAGGLGATRLCNCWLAVGEV